MDEKPKEEEKKEEPVEPTPAKDVGDKAEGEDQFEKAAKVVADLKAENDRKEKMIEEIKKIETRQMMSGRAQAGQPPQEPQLSKEEIEANARIKAVGDATGAVWAKNMEKKDE